MLDMNEKPMPAPAVLFDGANVTEEYERWEAAVEYFNEPVYGWEEDYDPLPPEFGDEPGEEVPF